MKIRKTVFPIASLGARFLLANIATLEELLTIHRQADYPVCCGVDYLHGPQDRPQGDGLHFTTLAPNKVRAMTLACDRYAYDSKVGYLEALLNLALGYPGYAKPFKALVSGKLTAKLY